MRRSGLDSIKRADGILILALLFIALAAFLIRGCLTERGDRVVVTVDGQVTGEYSLEEDRKVLIEGDSFYNELTIKDHQADMTRADCRDKICVRHKPVSQVGETIVCLPHKVIVTVRGEKKSPGIDGISR